MPGHKKRDAKVGRVTPCAPRRGICGDGAHGVTRPTDCGGQKPNIIRVLVAEVPPAVAAKLAERLPTEELTPRELDVLRLLAEGKPNKLIGAGLAITEVTVKSHVQALFRKLNVLSRTEAIAVANRRGLLRV